ncbi:MAG: hypothetical protein IT178_03200 [Acidobacteria bacterium]|nr:hypothetical protein [Acidobacteriota bacterium]
MKALHIVRRSRASSLSARRPHNVRAATTLAMLLAVLSVLPVAAQPLDPLAAVSWMAGCWSFRSDGRTVDEQWMRPAGGVMLGMSRSVPDGRAGSFEFAVMHTQDGRLVYDARPEGQARTLFPLAKAGADEVIFENLAHDFPQRVIYRRLGNDRMQARVEGRTARGDQGFDYPFARVACPQ